MSKVVFGNMPRRTKPNRTVRPPTEPGQANTINWTRTAGSGSSIVFTVPSGGSLVLAAIDQGDGVFTPPAGWTSLGTASTVTDVLEIFYTLTPGASATFTSTSSDEWYVDAIAISGGVDWATNPPEATFATGTFDAPAISPSGAPGTYGVFSFFGYRRNALLLPAGYVAVSDNSGSATGDPAVFDAFKLVDITTTEDPGVWTMEAGGGYGQQLATVALLFETDPAVASGVHTHTEVQVSDIDTLTQKATPIDADRIKIYDSADADTFKYAELGDLPGGGVTDHGALTGLTPDDDHPHLAHAAGGRVLFSNHGNAGASETVDLSLASMHRLTLDSASCAITLSGAAATRDGNAVTWDVVIELDQDGTGGREVTWTDTITWVGGSAPDLSGEAAGTRAIVVLYTSDGGTSYVGVQVGADSSHTHVEADVTDLDHWTESDHDALDHTGLTGVGGGGGEILISDTPSTPLVFADLLQNEAQDDLIYQD